MAPIVAQMKGMLLACAFIVMFAIPDFAASTDNTNWSKANQLYQQKQYDSALAYFQLVAATHPNTAEVYYNMGNTCYKLNKVALAVLNYERALNIRPDYKEAQENLWLTQSHINNHVQDATDVFFINWWKNITASDKANKWAVWALIVFILMVALLVINRVRKQNQALIPKQIPGILAFVWVCIMLLAFVATKHLDKSDVAVVMFNDAPLMNNEIKGKPLSLIPEGTTVKMSTIKGEYVEVTLPDGRTGWVQLNLLNKI